MGIALNLVNVDAKSDGGEKTAKNVMLTLDANMAAAGNRGNVTVNLVGAECSVIKVNIGAKRKIKRQLQLLIDRCLPDWSNTVRKCVCFV